jgi:hypothetical protein
MYFISIENTVLYPCENWVTFGRNTPCKSQFSVWRKAHFVVKSPIQLCCRNTCVYRREWFVLEAGACSTLFTCVNWVRLWKKYFLQIIVFKVQKCYPCSKWACLAKLKKHMFLLKKTSLLWVKTSSILLPSEIWVSFWENTSCTSAFSTVTKAQFIKQSYSAKLKKHIYLSKWNHPC